MVSRISISNFYHPWHPEERLAKEIKAALAEEERLKKEAKEQALKQQQDAAMKEAEAKRLMLVNHARQELEKSKAKDKGRATQEDVDKLFGTSAALGVYVHVPLSTTSGMFVCTLHHK